MTLTDSTGIRSTLRPMATAAAFALVSALAAADVTIAGITFQDDGFATNLIAASPPSGIGDFSSEGLGMSGFDLTLPADLRQLESLLTGPDLESWTGMRTPGSSVTLAFGGLVPGDGFGADIAIFDIGNVESIDVTIGAITRTYAFEFSGQTISQGAATQTVNQALVDLADFGVASTTTIVLGAPAGGVDDPDPTVIGVINAACLAQVYCTAKVSSAGCVATLSTSDPCTSPTSGGADYFVTAAQVQELKNGLLFAGISGPANLPFSGGTLCVQPPTRRGPILNAGGDDPLQCDGAFATLVNDGVVLPAGLDAGSGNTAWYQYWYRDPQNGPGNLGTALSNAVQLDFL